MPTERKVYGGTKIFYGENELPRNATKFIKEIDKSGFTIFEVNYEMFIPDGTDVENNEEHNELDISIYIDAEYAAKNYRSNTSIGRLLDGKYESLGQALGIDRVWFFTKYKDKDIFANKFLKRLKLDLKKTDLKDVIHSIRFDVKDMRNLELIIVKKRDNWRFSDRTIKEKVENYLESIGYPNIKIHIP
jgi:hypothetical protein